MVTPPLVSSFEEALRCPRCKRIAYRRDPEIYVGCLTCDRCAAHWWATRFQAGSVRGQLLADYDGDLALVAELMNHFAIPDSIVTPMFWQLQLTGNQLHRYNTDASPGVRGRSTSLLRGVLALLRRAS